jgi:hypothetical protein
MVPNGAQVRIGQISKEKISNNITYFVGFAKTSTIKIRSS